MPGSNAGGNARAQRNFYNKIAARNSNQDAPDPDTEMLDRFVSSLM